MIEYSDHTLIIRKRVPDLTFVCQSVPETISITAGANFHRAFTITVCFLSTILAGAFKVISFLVSKLTTLVTLDRSLLGAILDLVSNLAAEVARLLGFLV